MAAIKHGESNTRLYWQWADMVRRCTSPRHQKYADYGGRGITVCERWMEFGNFRADVGEKPDGLTLDRIDNNGPYAPGNVRWANRTTQNRNSRRARLIEIGGESRCISEWLERVGVTYGVYKQRIRGGWPIDKALTTPPGRPWANKTGPRRFSEEHRRKLSEAAKRRNQA